MVWVISVLFMGVFFGGARGGGGGGGGGFNGLRKDKSYDFLLEPSGTSNGTKL